MSKKQKGQKQKTPSKQDHKQRSAKLPKHVPEQWNVCPFCGLNIHSSEDHKDENCGESSRDEFHASLAEAIELKVYQPEQGEDKASSWMYSKEPIFINRQLLGEIRGTVGSPVVVNNHFVAYFSLVNDFKYLESSVGAHRQFLDRVRERFQSEFVILRLIPLPFIDASEVLVSLLNGDPIGVDPSFLKFAKTKFLSEFVTTGIEKTLSYMGRLLCLRVERVVDGNGDILENRQHGDSCVCNGRAESKRFFQVVRETNVAWFCGPRMALKRNRLEQIGGYEDQRKALEDFTSHAALSQHDEYCSRGLLICGPTGSGKTSLIRSISSASTVALSEIDISHLSQCTDERAVSLLLEHASVREPCIVVLDKLHVLCSCSNPLPKGSAWSFTTAVTNAMDVMRKARKRVFFIGVANKLEDVHRDLLDAARFGIHVEMGYPSVQERYEIFKMCLESIENNLLLTDIMRVAEETHGFVGRDFVTICDIASGEAVLKQKQKSNDEEEVVPVNLNDVMSAVKIQKRVLMQDSALAITPVGWDDIGGQQELKNLLKRVVESAVSSAYGHKKGSYCEEKGVLLYGPPGCCKTMIAKAVATHCSANFFAVQGPELLSKYVGESERMVRELFSSARQAAPSVVFFDEIDAIAGPRDGGENDVTSGVVSTLLTEIGGVQNLRGVAVIASTNLPYRIDPALLIQSRLGRHYYVRLPDMETRREILRLQFSRRSVANDVELEELVRRTEGFSGAELVGLCSRAASLAMIEDLSAIEIRYRHFLSTIDDIVPLATQDMLSMYEKFADARQSESNSF